MRKVFEKLIETTVKTDFNFRPELFFHSVGVLRAADHLDKCSYIWCQYQIIKSDASGRTFEIKTKTPHIPTSTDHCLSSM